MVAASYHGCAHISLYLECCYNHVTPNVPIMYYLPSVCNMSQRLSSDCSNIGLCVKVQHERVLNPKKRLFHKHDILLLYYINSQGSLDPINKCLSEQLEVLAGVVKLELYTGELHIKVEGI